MRINYSSCCSTVHTKHYLRPINFRRKSETIYRGAKRKTLRLAVHMYSHPPRGRRQTIRFLKTIWYIYIIMSRQNLFFFGLFLFCPPPSTLFAITERRRERVHPRNVHERRLTTNGIVDGCRPGAMAAVESRHTRPAAQRGDYSLHHHPPGP